MTVVLLGHTYSARPVRLSDAAAAPLAFTFIPCGRTRAASRKERLGHGRQLCIAGDWSKSGPNKWYVMPPSRKLRKGVSSEAGRFIVQSRF